MKPFDFKEEHFRESVIIQLMEQINIFEKKASA